jgi:SEC-C motif
MAKVQRNQPCPCGSGSKAKRCCHGPIQFVDLRVMPLEMGQEALDVLAGTDKTEMRALFDQLVYLPELDLSLQVPLPAILTPDVDRAVRALRGDDGDAFDEALAKVVSMVDTLDRKIDLAQAVVVLRDAGRISPKLAALAVFDLDRPDSSLFLSSVAESIGVLAGEERTPTGLLVAAR